MAIIEGWKLVRKDGSTYDEFRWPMPVAGVTDPVVVEAYDIDLDNTRACPSRPGDGLCVALTPAGATSSGISLSEGVGLSLTYDEADVLGREASKLRVAKVTVVDTFDPLAKVRSGRWKALSGVKLARADLLQANLTGANLAGANLAGADLYGANLREADLFGADLRRADLTWAVLTGANLTRAVLTGANLSWADLSGACGEPRSGMPAGWRLDAEGRWEWANE